MFIIIIVLAAMWPRSYNENPPHVCDTPSCLRAAAQVRAFTPQAIHRPFFIPLHFLRFCWCRLFVCLPLRLNGGGGGQKAGEYYWCCWGGNILSSSSHLISNKDVGTFRHRKGGKLTSRSGSAEPMRPGVWTGRRAGTAPRALPETNPSLALIGVSDIVTAVIKPTHEMFMKCWLHALHIYCTLSPRLITKRNETYNNSKTETTSSNSSNSNNNNRTTITAKTQRKNVKGTDHMNSVSI